MEAELKPCPFCGSEAILKESKEWFNVYVVHCLGAECHTEVGWDTEPPYGTSKEQVIKIWNKRV